MNQLIFYNLNNFGLLDKGYELYLRDFINNSILKEKYGNFIEPISECHGEDDANSLSGYSIDFKRFITQDECRYKRLNDFSKYDIVYKDDDTKLTNTYFDMFKCMKKLKYQEFYQIKYRKYKFINSIEQKEYENMIDRLLMKNKNIMLYLPKIILISNNKLKYIIDYFDNELKSMFEFRRKNVKKDLYFTFIISNDINNPNSYRFVITQYKNSKLKLIDTVSTRCSNLFHMYDKK